MTFGLDLFLFDELNHRSSGDKKVIGKTISHYTILKKIGEGGMGEVYKAKNTKLMRTIALKFLPRELTRDQEARERFVKEAQAAGN